MVVQRLKPFKTLSFRYNRKAPLCKSPRETAWLFHEIGNCFLMMKIYEYAHESGLKAVKSAQEANHKRLQLQSYVLVAVAEGKEDFFQRIFIFLNK